jgi:Tol biopolymer transport system component
LSDSGAYAAGITGLVLGVSFVVLFSIFSADLGDYPDASKREQNPAAKLIFSITADAGNSQIYIVSTDGTGLTNLTNDKAWNFSPLVSPDKTKIAYLSSKERPFDSVTNLYVMNADGTNRTRLTDDGFTSGMRFVWSPDGTKIAYESSVEGQQEIIVATVDGKLTRVTERAETYEARPAWSSSDTVVFESISFDEYNMPNGASLMEAEVDGSGLKTVINYTKDTGNYVLSPDLSKIAFVQARKVVPDDEYVYSLHVMDIDGGNPQKVAEGFWHFDFDVRWSYDSRQIAFQASRWDQPMPRIFLVDLDKGVVRNVSNTATNEWHPIWSSTGRLAFVKDVGEYFPAIHATDTHLGNQQRVAEIRYPFMAGSVDWLEE